MTWKFWEFLKRQEVDREEMVLEMIRASELRPGGHVYLLVIRQGAMSQHMMRLVQTYLQNKGVSAVWLIVRDVNDLRVIVAETLIQASTKNESA